jgi:hypothetical protein
MKQTKNKEQNIVTDDWLKALLGNGLLNTLEPTNTQQ